ncbi:MAG: CopG family antitoxin [Phyllobacterium sp.]
MKPIPALETEAEESHGSTEHVDGSRAERGRLPNLKPTSTSIKIAANKRDTPYQSLIKVWLSEKRDTPHE